METMEMTINLVTLLILALSGGALYLKGRNDESMSNIKEDFKKLSEYGKIDSKKVTKDEVYKEKKW